jgi:hypothetical protein
MLTHSTNHNLLIIIVVLLLGLISGLKLDPVG